MTEVDDVTYVGLGYHGSRRSTPSRSTICLPLGADVPGRGSTAIYALATRPPEGAPRRPGGGRREQRDPSTVIGGGRCRPGST